MKIIIKESKEVTELDLIDPKSGVNYIVDFVGNSGAFDEGIFVWDEEQDAYVCSQETIDWWKRVVHDNQELENRLYELTQTYGRDVVYSVVTEAGAVDLEGHAAAVNVVLDDAFLKEEIR